MVWTYHEVKQLREKHAQGKEIQVSEIRSLEKYIKRKREVTQPNQAWSQKQLLRAEELLHDLNKNTHKKEVEI